MLKLTGQFAEKPTRGHVNSPMNFFICTLNKPNTNPMPIHC